MINLQKVDMIEKAQGKENDKAAQVRNEVTRLRTENDQLKDRLAKLEPHVFINLPYLHFMLHATL